MSNWFECKVKYGKVDSSGKTKSVSETYLVDAISFAEAEDRISREVAPFVNGEFKITGLKMANVNEIFPHEEGDRWFRCKVYFVSVDEVKGTEKRIASNILVFGSDIDNAWQHLNASLADTMSDFEVASIADTTIIDIFPYSETEGNGLTPDKKTIGVTQTADDLDLIAEHDAQEE